MQIKEKNRCRNRQQPFAKNLNQYEVLYLDITLFLSTLKQDEKHFATILDVSGPETYNKCWIKREKNGGNQMALSKKPVNGMKRYITCRDGNP